jgi:translation elongation factor EF-Tu-like GTPase
MTENKSNAILKLTQPDGTVQEVTVEQLALSNNVTYQALVTLLIKKGIIDGEDLLQEVNRIHKGRIEAK